MIGIDDVDGEVIYLTLVTNFKNNMKQAYRQSRMAQKIFKDLSEDSRNNYNKKH